MVFSKKISSKKLPSLLILVNLSNILFSGENYLFCPSKTFKKRKKRKKKFDLTPQCLHASPRPINPYFPINATKKSSKAIIPIEWYVWGCHC